MKRRFTLINEEVRDRALEEIGLLDLGGDQLYEVIIQTQKATLSTAQRSLYWVWLDQVSKHSGYLKDELHLDYKGRFLVPIYERDDDEYAKMIDSLRDVYKKGMRGHAEMLHRQVVKLTSIMDANTEQMSEYLNAIQAYVMDNYNLHLDNSRLEDFR